MLAVSTQFSGHYLYLLFVSGLLLGVPPRIGHEEAHGDVVLSGVSHGLDQWWRTQGRHNHQLEVSR